MGFRTIRQVGASIILICVLGLFHEPVMAAVARIVPTFHAIGIYYSSSDGAESNTCSVQYKIAEENTWQAGLDLWYDARNNEYRMSESGATTSTVHTSVSPPHRFTRVRFISGKT